MATTKTEPTTLDKIQEFIDQTLVEVRDIEVRTRTDDRVKELQSRLRQVEFDHISISERIARVQDCVTQLMTVRTMLAAAQDDMAVEMRVIHASLDTYRTQGYTAGGPKVAAVVEDDSSESLLDEQQQQAQET